MQTDTDYITYLTNWIDLVATPLPELNGMATCPFAKQAKRNQVLIEKINMLDIAPPTTDDFEVIMYVVEDSIDPETLLAQANLLNSQYPNLVFLADHPLDPIDTGVATAHSSNGKYNLLLCQPKVKLTEARKKLVKSSYYSFWNPEYLKRIMGEDYGLLD